VVGGYSERLAVPQEAKIPYREGNRYRDRIRTLRSRGRNHPTKKPFREGRRASGLYRSMRFKEYLQEDAPAGEGPSLNKGNNIIIEAHVDGERS